MNIIDVYGTITDKIVISEKFGLVLSNVEDAEWKTGLIDEIREEIDERERVAARSGPYYEVESYDLEELMSSPYFRTTFLQSDKIDAIERLVGSLTCIHVNDFENTVLVNRNKYMDSPTCERCVEKKFINLYRFVVRNLHRGASTAITYCTDGIESKSRMVLALAARQRMRTRARSVFDDYASERELQIQDLAKFGALIDDFIESESDFFLLEYIMDALDENDDHNAYYVFKIVSLIEMLVKGPKDEKWSNVHYETFAKFIKTSGNAKKLAQLIVQIRHKIGHGDYRGLSKKLEKYATGHMKDYRFDYYEYSRNNWVFLNLGCLLNETLARIIWAYLNDKSLMKHFYT